MRRIQILTCAVLMGLLTACSTPEQDAAKAQKRSYDALGAVAKERLELVTTSGRSILLCRLYLGPRT